VRKRKYVPWMKPQNSGARWAKRADHLYCAPTVGSLEGNQFSYLNIREILFAIYSHRSHFPQRCSDKSRPNTRDNGAINNSSRSAIQPCELKRQTNTLPSGLEREAKIVDGERVDVSLRPGSTNCPRDKTRKLRWTYLTSNLSFADVGASWALRPEEFPSARSPSW